VSLQLVSAVTLFVGDMARSCDFYQKMGFGLKFGGPQTKFTSLWAGQSFLNLVLHEAPETGWGRAIFHVEDVDRFYARCRQQGLEAAFEPRDAPWGERYFHIRDPDGHELSFAHPLGD